MIPPQTAVCPASPELSLYFRTDQGWGVVPGIWGCWRSKAQDNQSPTEDTQHVVKLLTFSSSNKIALIHRHSLLWSLYFGKEKWGYNFIFVCALFWVISHRVTNHPKLAWNNDNLLLPSLLLYITFICHGFHGWLGSVKPFSLGVLCCLVVAEGCRGWWPIYLEVDAGCDCQAKHLSMAFPWDLTARALQTVTYVIFNLSRFPQALPRFKERQHWFHVLIDE